MRRLIMKNSHFHFLTSVTSHNIMFPISDWFRSGIAISKGKQVEMGMNCSAPVPVLRKPCALPSPASSAQLPTSACACLLRCLPTQKQCYRLPCPTSLFQWAAITRGDGGKHGWMGSCIEDAGMEVRISWAMGECIKAPGECLHNTCAGAEPNLTKQWFVSIFMSK